MIINGFIHSFFFAVSTSKVKVWMRDEILSYEMI